MFFASELRSWSFSGLNGQCWYLKSVLTPWWSRHLKVESCTESKLSLLKESFLFPQHRLVAQEFHDGIISPSDIIQNSHGDTAYTIPQKIPQFAQKAYQLAYDNFLRTIWYVLAALSEMTFILSIVTRNKILDRGLISKHTYIRSFKYSFLSWWNLSLLKRTKLNFLRPQGNLYLVLWIPCTYFQINYHDVFFMGFFLLSLM
jgi:hypothetical protein